MIMWYVIRGDIEGLDCQKCKSYSVAVSVMLEQITSRIDAYGLYCDDFDIGRYNAWVSTNEGTYNWKIIKVAEEIRTD